MGRTYYTVSERREDYLELGLFGFADTVALIGIIILGFVSTYNIIALPFLIVIGVLVAYAIRLEYELFMMVFPLWKLPKTPNSLDNYIHKR